MTHSYDLTNWMVGWNTNYPHDDKADKGDCLVREYPDRSGWTNEWDGTDGCCWGRKWTLDKVLACFHRLVVVDGVEPRQLHQQLMKIQEYRAYCDSMGHGFAFD